MSLCGPNLIQTTTPRFSFFSLCCFSLRGGSCCFFPWEGHSALSSPSPTIRQVFFLVEQASNSTRQQLVSATRSHAIIIWWAHVTEHRMLLSKPRMAFLSQRPMSQLLALWKLVSSGKVFGSGVLLSNYGQQPRMMAVASAVLSTSGASLTEIHRKVSYT